MRVWSGVELNTVMTIYDAPHIWVFFGVCVVLFLIATEVGFRMGVWQAQRSDVPETSHTGILTGAILGLVSFLLAFTFGIAASNFSERRGTVLDEANAIGTAYLRADLLPEAEAAQMRSLLRQYTEVRVAVTEPGVTVEGYFLVIRQSESIHYDLWSLVARVAKADPLPTHSLVVVAVNEVIDMHAKRVAAGVRHTIPPTIWIALYLVSSLALGATGYRIGANVGKRSELLPAMVIAFACVVSLISDLDNPRHGFLLSDQTPMRAVLETMS